MKKILMLIALGCSFAINAQYVHQSGQNIVDGNGQNLLLRGLGLGGWMVQEAYMLQMESFAGPQHQIKDKIKGLIGDANTATFYANWRANGITKRDIDSLAAWGFNSIRLPMHYNLYTLPIEQEPVAGQNTWVDEGFTMTDNLLSWCAANNMYLILDMHATPGGQGKDAAISDYDSTKPSLWESQANRDKLVALWKKLAERYKNSPWIAGYDLINEPNWAFTGTNINGCDENSNAPLRNLYIAITNAIRQVDTNHMIIIEGNCWGNNYNGMFPLWDNNMALSFHKYWNANNTSAIQGILNYRTQYNVPLWLGESGENSNVWFTDAISLVESLNIGWAFWPMKKIENIAGVTMVTKPAGYDTLLNYWKNGGTAPTSAAATTTLLQVAENYKMQNVTIMKDVKDAMFRQVQSNTTVKYKNHPIPGKVYATEYDMGRLNAAYYDTDVANYRTDSGTFTPWNSGYAMRNDGVDIQASTDSPTNGFMVGYIQNKEWLVYTLNAPADTAYDIDIRYAGTGKIYFEDANGKISELYTLAPTGGFTNWGTATLADVILKQGENKVKLYVQSAGFNLNYFELKNARPAASIDMKMLDANTSLLGDKVIVTFNKPLIAGLNFSQSAFVLKVNNTPVTVTSIDYSGNNTITLKTAVGFGQNDVLTLSYGGSNIKATDNTVQAQFTNKPVNNSVGNIIGISGKIEAENYFFNSGLTVETTADTGGGSDIGYTDNGDYLDYLVNIGEAGNYTIEYRHSGLNVTGQIKLQLLADSGTTDIQTVSLTPTGGWQTWSTQSSSAVLPAGRYILRLLVVNAGFNLNWVKLTLVPTDDDGDNVSNANDACPDTPANDVVDFNGCTVFSLPNNNFVLKTTSETCRSANNGKIDITAVAGNNYTATLTGAANASNTFTSATSFTGLTAGTYTVTITLPDHPTFKRSYNVNVEEPTDLAVMSRVSNESFSVTLDLSGADLYRVELNGVLMVTDQPSVTLQLKAGLNNLKVSTNKECQGIFQRSIQMDNKAIIFPNPVTDVLNIRVPMEKEQNAVVRLFTLTGKLVMENTVLTHGDLSVATSALVPGVYLLTVVSADNTFNSKFIKK